LISADSYDVIDAIMLGGLLGVIARMTSLDRSAGFTVLMLVLAGACLGWKFHVVRSKKLSK